MKKRLLLLCLTLVFIPALFAQTYQLGDVNHSSTIDIVDALVVAQYTVGLNPANFYSAQADVNGSGSIDIVDALMIAQYYVGLITSFPGQQATATRTATMTATRTATMTATRTATSNATIPPTSNSIIGYATQNGGTTGGKGGTTVTVSTGTALQDALSNKGSSPLIIYVSGTISPSNSGDLSKIDVKDIADVSIFNGEFNGIGIKIWRADNIIIRNVKLHHVNIGDKDAIGIQESTNVWIDHNEVYSDITSGKDYYDGAIDVTHGADWVTISFNYVHDHYKTSLVGHSDDAASEDTGKLHVTYYGNYFTNISSRSPSFRFGTGHVFNNYFANYFDASSAISSRMGAQMRIENNVSVGVLDSVMTDQSPTTGAVQLIGNNFSGTVATSPTCSITMPYSYSLQPVSNVPSWCQTNAGVGKVTPENF